MSTCFLNLWIVYAVGLALGLLVKVRPQSRSNAIALFISVIVVSLLLLVFASFAGEVGAGFALAPIVFLGSRIMFLALGYSAAARGQLMV